MTDVTVRCRGRLSINLMEAAALALLLRALAVGTAIGHSTTRPANTVISQRVAVAGPGGPADGVPASVLPDLFGQRNASFHQLMTEPAATVTAASAGAAA
ncbi:MAG TPA: hypothetical protein VGE81_05160 [Candidatus Limnocylindrales bacterium]|jgi:hypothetical protein